MLNEDLEGYYEGITIAPDEWKAIEALNSVLEVSWLALSKFIHCPKLMTMISWTLDLPPVN